ncbi:hypothetical protein ACS0TY_035865 [Phlomoides rotata]
MLFLEKKIPSFIGSFAKLEYLNLSGSGFYGEVPHSIGNLSNLRVFDLQIHNQLGVDSLEWLSGLSQLEYLNMNFVHLSKVNNWAQVIFSLPSLVELQFQFCSLDFFMAHLDFVNITSLKHLYLSGARFYEQPSTIMPWIFQLSNLLSLDLSSNNLIGPIPTSSNATKLHRIDISSNYCINSSIPDWLYLCKDLEFVDLSSNLLTGGISNSIANLTALNSLLLNIPMSFLEKYQKKLQNCAKYKVWNLSENNFQGEISDPFGDISECFLKALANLNLWNNKLSGHLTNQFGEFKSLQILDLRNNSLSGVIPINIGMLSSLEELLLLLGKTRNFHFRPAGQR